MQTTTRDRSETSVAFSLAELARLEEDRVREEDDRRARSREREAREQREAEARRRAEEEEQLAAHELAVLRVRTDGSRRKLQIALSVVIGLVALGGPAAAYGVHKQVTTLEQDNAQLRESREALSKEHDQARTTELAALDKRFSALIMRPILVTDARAAEEARATADAARKALDAKALDHNRLRAFGDALDALQARIEGLERLSALDRRMADLDAWAAQRKKPDAAAQAHTAATRARTLPDDKTLRTYESELDRLRDSLAKDGARGGGGIGSSGSPGQGTCTDPHDPMCGFNGQPL